MHAQKKNQTGLTSISRHYYGALVFGGKLHFETLSKLFGCERLRSDLSLLSFSFGCFYPAINPT